MSSNSLLVISNSARRFAARRVAVILALALAVGIASAQDTIPEPVGALVFADTQPAAHLSRGARLALELKERGVGPELVVMAIATLPIVELRGAVPVGINLFRMPWYTAVLLSLVGNMVPIFLILFLLERVTAWLSRIGFFARFFEWLFARTRRKSGLIERYEFWGLVLFVAIPLPVTGAWTGSVAAVIMGIRYWRALLAISIGVLIASVIVTTLSLLGTWGAVIAGVALAAVIANAVIGGLRRRRTGRDKPQA